MIQLLLLLLLWYGYSLHFLNVWVMCVCERERRRENGCVCVCVRERERERENHKENACVCGTLIVAEHFFYLFSLAHLWDGICLKYLNIFNTDLSEHKIHPNKSNTFISKTVLMEPILATCLTITMNSIENTVSLKGWGAIVGRILGRNFNCEMMYIRGISCFSFFAK